MSVIEQILSKGAGFGQLHEDVTTMNRNVERLYKSNEELRKAIDLMRVELKIWNDRAARQ